MVFWSSGPLFTPRFSGFNFMVRGPGRDPVVHLVGHQSPGHEPQTMPDAGSWPDRWVCLIIDLCVLLCPCVPWEPVVWAVTLAPSQRATIAINAQTLGREARPIKSTVGSVKHGLPLRFPRPVPWDGNRPELAFGCSSFTSCSPGSPPHRAAEREMVCLCCLVCLASTFLVFTKTPARSAFRHP